MEALASLVWTLALLAGVAFVLLQWWRERAAQRERQRSALERQDRPAALAQPVAATAAKPMPAAAPEPWGRAPQPSQQAPRDRRDLEESLASLESLGSQEPLESPESLVPLLQPRPSTEAAGRQAPATQPWQDSRPTLEPRRRALRTRADLRHAMVTMAVLGPCRAQQPWRDEGDTALPGR